MADSGSSSRDAAVVGERELRLAVQGFQGGWHRILEIVSSVYREKEDRERRQQASN